MGGNHIQAGPPPNESGNILRRGEKEQNGLDVSSKSQQCPCYDKNVRDGPEDRSLSGKG